MGATSDLLVSIALVPFAVCPFADKHPSLINSLKWRVPSALENRTGADISAPNCWIILQSIIAKKNLGLPSHLKVEDGSQFAPSAKGGMYKWSLLFFWDLGLTLSLPNPRTPPALGQILANALPPWCRRHMYNVPNLSSHHRRHAMNLAFCRLFVGRLFACSENEIKATYFVTLLSLSPDSPRLSSSFDPLITTLSRLLRTAQTSNLSTARVA